MFHQPVMVNQKLKKRALHRARIIRGQLEGLIKAIDQELYCTQLLEQTRSIQRSLKSLDAFLIENHLRSHVKHQINGKEESKTISELIKLYVLSNK
ncbi:MAG: metal-sensitive transcriptional regulator [Candidatus Magasanikbacteria bacterium]|nr:metal-sensitive transcriptional regulator [Candidatus Magasanikbacteria bacterium]